MNTVPSEELHRKAALAASRGESLNNAAEKTHRKLLGGKADRESEMKDKGSIQGSEEARERICAPRVALVEMEERVGQGGEKIDEEARAAQELERKAAQAASLEASGESAAAAYYRVLTGGKELANLSWNDSPRKWSREVGNNGRSKNEASAIETNSAKKEKLRKKVSSPVFSNSMMKREGIKMRRMILRKTKFPMPLALPCPSLRPYPSACSPTNGVSEASPASLVGAAEQLIQSCDSSWYETYCKLLWVSKMLYVAAFLLYGVSNKLFAHARTIHVCGARIKLMVT